jgi:hypothetical protein
MYTYICIHTHTRAQMSEDQNHYQRSYIHAQRMYMVGGDGHASEKAQVLQQRVAAAETEIRRVNSAVREFLGEPYATFVNGGVDGSDANGRERHSDGAFADVDEMNHHGANGRDVLEGDVHGRASPLDQAESVNVLVKFCDDDEARRALSLQVCVVCALCVYVVCMFVLICACRCRFEKGLREESSRHSRKRYF